MTRLYDRPGHGIPRRVLIIFLTGLILLGFWYPVFQTLASPPDGGSGPWLFSIAFLATGFGGLFGILNGARDQVIALDMDEHDGRVVIWFRGPLGARRIKTEIHRLSNWRYHSSGTSKRARYRRILVDLAGRARPLVFEVRLAQPPPDGLRRLAPEAVADYERDVGIA